MSQKELFMSKYRYMILAMVLQLGWGLNFYLLLEKTNTDLGFLVRTIGVGIPPLGGVMGYIPF